MSKRDKKPTTQQVLEEARGRGYEVLCSAAQREVEGVAVDRTGTGSLTSDEIRVTLSLTLWQLNCLTDMNVHLEAAVRLAAEARRALEMK